MVAGELRQVLAEASRHAQAGRLAEAVASYRRAISLDPNIAGMHVNLAIALKHMGRLDEASASCRRAIALKPNLAEAHYNLGLVLRELGQLDEAIASYRQAIALRPDFVEAHCNAGNVLKTLGRQDEAIAAYRNGLVLAPSDPEIIHNLATVLYDQGELHEAVELYRRAIAIKPDFALAIGNLTHARLDTCDWNGLDEDMNKCRALVQAGVRGVQPFAFLSVTDSPSEHLRCARLEAAAAAVAVTEKLPAAPPRTREKLRLAYLSGDFRQHPSAILTAELFERHDRGRFEVSAYSLGPDDGSAMRRRLIKAFDRFIDIRPLSHADAAKRIREDGIDILVDLMGYTKFARTPIVAARPAPIQVNFLGYIGTMGAPFIDYTVADAVALPMTDQPHYDERIVHLPDCFMPTDTRREVDERTPTRAECGLPKTGFVFCCFNTSYKITPAMFDIWMRLLRAVPGSVLWLVESNSIADANLEREAASRGVDASRVILAPRQPLPQHLARHRLADLFLDTLPRNAHTTANLALWMGLPVLTCRGDTFHGRGATSLLLTIGLPELVTPSLSAYEALAMRLATDPALLGTLRRRLEQNRDTTPLFDMARYTRRLEAAYFRMWDTWTAGRPPQAFAVPP